MADDETRNTRLEAAGYIGPRGQAIFCGLAGIVGGLLGSVYLAIALNVVLGPEWDTFDTIAGGIAGAALGFGLALYKVRSGNLEALETVEDGEWKRSLVLMKPRKGRS